MKTDQKLLQDMLHAVDTILSYELSSYEAFFKDGKSQDAIMYNLIILGEAANQISDEFQDAHPKIPWSSVIGTRNVIVHGYDQVKLPIVWDILTKNLLPLKETLTTLFE
jgi:uncharacterized protein with HEPN domain